MNEPIVICPKCKHEIHLTESLAAPLVAKVKDEYEQKLSSKDSEITKREGEILAKEKKIIEDQQNIRDAIAAGVHEKLVEEKIKIVNEEQQKADLRAKEELIKKERKLNKKEQETEIIIQRGIQDGLSAVEANARKKAEDSLHMKLMEKDQTITSMQKTIADLQRKSEQGSQQLQGEVQEILLESILQKHFPSDEITQAPKGQCGGDIVQNVYDSRHHHCGMILWESKRTKNWSDSWLSKLRDDQHSIKADIAVLATQVLPN